MSEELNEDTSFKLSVKTLIAIGFAMVTLISMWFMLQADIAEAKILPKNEWNPEWEEKLPANDVSRMEFDMKDKNIRLSIENTEKSVEDIKKTLERMEDKLYDR